MGVVVRTLLTWLLVLAVPAQGAAAATMAFCSPNGHGAASSMADIKSSASEHSHHRGDMSVHESDSGASAEAALADDGTTPASQGTNQKCSVCVSCCSLGAIPTSMQGISATDPAPTVFTTVVPTVDPFAADGPDRPPRHIFA